ncbi:MAG: TlpA disulfide reductase family protein [Sedimentisphaerales bacterium]
MASKNELRLQDRKIIIFAGLSLLLCGAVIFYYTLSRQIILKVVGPDGKVLSGIEIYMDYTVQDGRRDSGYVCDKKGLVHLPKGEVFRDEWERKKGVGLYGLYEDKLAGFVDVNTSDLNKEVELKLTPACRVNGKIKSTELTNLGQEVKMLKERLKNGLMPIVYVWRGNDKWQKARLCYLGQKEEFEFFLPEGTYKLKAYGFRTDYKYEDIEIAAGQKELEINFDLPADRLAHLIGKEAPELQQIKGWINSEPIKLADLRGKVVLLDFWGIWCGACVEGMPNLIDLHEKYHDKGLVIIAIHTDSMSSVEELEKEIKKLSKENWNGREMPFAVALDGGGKYKVEGARPTVLGATTAAYGINSFPTTVLIDKKGKVVEDLYIGPAVYVTDKKGKVVKKESYYESAAAEVLKKLNEP